MKRSINNGIQIQTHLFRILGNNPVSRRGSALEHRGSALEHLIFTVILRINGVE